jgi:hypothetical protein
VWYHPASSKFCLTILFPLSVSGKLTGTLSGFIACVKPASFGLLCAWREVLILRQQGVDTNTWKKMTGFRGIMFSDDVFWKLFDMATDSSTYLNVSSSQTSTLVVHGVKAYGSFCVWH